LLRTREERQVDLEFSDLVLVAPKDSGTVGEGAPTSLRRG